MMINHLARPVITKVECILPTCYLLETMWNIFLTAHNTFIHIYEDYVASVEYGSNIRK